MRIRNGQGYTLLVVDDEEVLREAIAHEFERHGFKVLVAGNGKTALDVVKVNRVDLVVSDIRMPGGDGIALLRGMSAVTEKAPPLIFVTGFADVSPEECISLGALKVFPKPFDREELIRTVFEILKLV